MKYFNFKRFVNSKVLIIILFSFVLHKKSNASKASWLNNFFNNVQSESKVHQVLFLFNQSIKAINFKIEETILMSSRDFPIIKLSFEEATTKKARELSLLPSFQDTRATTLIIIIYSNLKNELHNQDLDSIHFMSNLSSSKIRPRILFISLQEESSDYEELLRYMWSKHFLDVTLLEVVESFPKMEEMSRNYYHNLGENLTTLHNFNPFNNIISKNSYSSSVFCFRDKTRNLKGSQMKIGLFNKPGSAYITYNHAKQIINASGPDVKLLETLSQAMNFKPKWVSSGDEGWGKLSCAKDNLTGLLDQTVRHEIQLIDVHGGKFVSCNFHFSEWTVGTTSFEINVLVPNFRQNSKISINWNLSNAFAFIGLIILTWMSSHLLQFESHQWRILDLVQVLLGWATQQNPERLAERILFATILWTCLLYSTLIYSAFTEIILQTEMELEFSNLDDVLSSNLLPAVSENIYIILYGNSEGNMRALLNRSILLSKESLLYLKSFCKKRNVACIIPGDLAQFLFKNDRDDSGRASIKILKETLISIPSGFSMEPRSPYVRRFDDLILRLVQSGLPELWRNRDSLKKTIERKNDESLKFGNEKSESMKKLIIWLLLVGCSFSIFVFLCEVLIAYATRRSDRDILPENHSGIDFSKEAPQPGFSRTLNPSAERILHQTWAEEINRVKEE